MQPPGAKAYPAQAFHPSLPNGRSSGDLLVSPAGFELVSGEHVMTAPLSGAQQAGRRRRSARIRHAPEGAGVVDLH
jgi:hypothetical protein